MPPGVYQGYILSPGNGMELSVAPGSEGVSVALVDYDGYSLTVSTKATEILDLGVSDQERTLRIVIEALYVQGNTETTAELKAILAENVQDHHVVLGTVVIPADATQLTSEMIVDTGREIAPTLATHLAADPAHPADRIEFDNSTAGLAGDPDRVQAAIEALKVALDGTSGGLADHEAADPAHAAAKISFDNSSAGLPGSPNRVQTAIEALAGNSSAYAAAQVKTVTVEAISTTDLKISKGVVSLPELGDDQVTNGDFETGDTTGWTGADATLAATGGAAQSGSYGLEVTATADGGSAQALITVEPEKFYRLSAHLKSSASGHQVRVTVRDQDHGIFLHQPDYEDLTDYSQRQALVFIPPGCTQVRLDLQAETSGEVGYFDNVSLEPAEFDTYHVPEELTLNPTGMMSLEWQYVMAQKPASGRILSASEITVTTGPPVYSADRTVLFDGDQRCLGVAMASGATTLWPHNVRGNHFSLREVFQAYELQPAAISETQVDLNLPALGELRVDVRAYWYPQSGSNNCLLINGDDTVQTNTLDDVGRSSDAVRQAAQPPMETDQEGRIKYVIEGAGSQCIIKIGWVGFELPLALRRR
jgi:hypothetical protein